MTDCFVSLKAKPIHVIVAATNAKTFKTWITRKMICHLNSNDLAKQYHVKKILMVLPPPSDEWISFPTFS